MEDVIEKIRKLLAHSAGGVSEEEAAAYIAKAHDLLSKHNLELSQVDFADGEYMPIDFGYMLDDDYYDAPWRKSVYSAAAAYSFCTYLSAKRKVRGRRSKKERTIGVHTFVGRKSNAIGAKIMADYVFEVSERLSREAIKRESARDPDRARAFGIAFKRGCAMRLAERLRELRRTSLNQPGIPAIYEGEGSLAQQFIADNFGKTKTKALTTKYKIDDGFVAGTIAAEDVQIGQQISNERAGEIDGR